MDGWTRQQVEAARAAGRTVVLLDVRSPQEFAAGSVPGARNVPPSALADEARALPADALVVTVCNHGGSRSQGAAQALREHGVASATHLVGGVHGPKPGH